MMKSFISYVAYALAVIITAGCVKVDIQYVPQDNTTATLLLKSMDLSKTRVSEEDAVLLKSQGALNENYIDHIQCFFLDSEMNVTYMTDIIAVEMPDTGEGVSAPVTIPSDIMKTLFSSGSCHLYVLANASEINAKPANLTSLKSATMISLSTDSTVPQQSFVMDGVAEDVKEENNVIEGEVYLERVASKIEIGLNIKKEISVGTTNPETWVPDTTRIKITYNNSVITSNLSATSIINEDCIDALVQEHNTQDGNTDERIKFDEDNESESYRTGNLKVPFYSYPNKWSSVTDGNAASIILEIPWKKKDAQNYMTYRYQIPVNFDNMEILRNHIYKLDITVGILGALTGTVELIPSYIVTDWQTLEINTSLSRPRYLVVDENKVVMNNVNSYSVGYSSSDIPITASIVSIIKPNLNGKVATYPNIIGSGNHGFSVNVEDPDDNGNGGRITLNHILQNDNEKENYDYVPYTVTVEVTNTLGYKEKIVFTQYPAVYIEAYLNSDYKDDNNNNNDNANDGYVFVGSGDGGVWGLGAATNANPNMYVISVSSLAPEMNYMIADPRVSSFNNLDLDKETNDLNGTTRKLSYYYPTNSSEENSNVIAPKFRIASSYGVTTQSSYKDMQERCATYQEDGYPAGRWRMPTKAEVEYIVMLSAKGYIPKLFNDDKDDPIGDYWCASGVVYPLRAGSVSIDQGTDKGSHAVRCVYDDWYWGSEREKSSGAETLTSFTWGDKARN